MMWNAKCARFNAHLRMIGIGVQKAKHFHRRTVSGFGPRRSTRPSINAFHPHSLDGTEYPGLLLHGSNPRQSCVACLVRSKVAASLIRTYLGLPAIPFVPTEHRRFPATGPASISRLSRLSRRPTVFSSLACPSKTCAALGLLPDQFAFIPRLTWLNGLNGLYWSVFHRKTPQDGMACCYALSAVLCTLKSTKCM